MAELGLAIAGVAATGGALAKALYGIYHSARDACKDAKEVAARLELLRAVLIELKDTLRKRDDICSETAESAITEMLEGCQDTFNDIERLTSPLLLGAQRRNIVGKLAWHFKKKDVRLHIARLDSIRDSITLIVSIQVLGGGLARRPAVEDAGVPLRLQKRLSRASQSVVNQRKTLIDLRAAENQAGDDEDEPEGSAVTLPSLGQRIAEVPGLGDDSSADDATGSSRSSALLSVQQRSITGSASNDVESLLELWTNLSEIRSQGPPSTRESSVSTASSHAGDVPEDDAADAPEAPTEPAACHEIGEGADDTAVSKFATVETVAEDETEADDASETSTIKEGAQEVESRAVKSSTKKSQIRVAVTELKSPLHTPSTVEARLADPIAAWLEQQEYSSSVSDNDGPMHHPGPFSDLHAGATEPSVTSSTVSSISSTASVSDPRRVKKLFRLGNKLMRMKKYAQALPLYKDVYQMRAALDPTELCELEHYIAVVLADQGKLDMAEKMFRKSLSRRSGSNAMQSRLPTEEYLARILTMQQNWIEAASIYGDLWASRRAHIKGSSPDSKARDAVARIGQNYSHILIELERYDEALVILEELHRETLATYGKQEHRTLAKTSLQLGQTYRHLARLPEAKSIFENILSRKWETDMSVSQLHGSCKRELAIIAYGEESYEDALQLARKARARLFPKRRRGDGDPDTTVVLESLECTRYIALCEYKLGEWRQSAGLLQTVSERLVALVGPGHKDSLQASLDRAEVHSSLGEDRKAQEILDVAYTAATAPEQDTANEKQLVHVSKRLGPLILNNTPNLKTQEDRMKSIARAATVYGSLYEAQKSQLGLTSLEVLQTGHEYGCIYSWLSKYSAAESILKEVWSGRNEILGENDVLSVETGLQLSHVYFRERKHRQAFALVGSLHDLQLSHFGPQSIQMVETAELMGYYNLSAPARRRNPENGLKLLRDAVALRQEHHGPSQDTCSAAVKLAVLEASNKQLENSAQLLDWVFRSGGSQVAVAEGETKLSGNLAIYAGISASGLTFLNRGKRAGNALFQEVVTRAETELGKTKALTQGLVYSQAALFFMQGDTGSMVEVLRTMYNRRRRLNGKHSKTAGASGRLLTLGLIADAVLSGKPIPAEADLLQGALLRSNVAQGAWSIRICYVLGIILMIVRLPSLGLPILKWVYRILKYTQGRLHSDTLGTLAVIHALSGYNFYHKVRGIASNEGTARDPRVILNNLWTRFTLRIHQGIYRRKGRGAPIVDAYLSNWFVQSALIKRFHMEMAGMDSFQTTMDTNLNWESFMFAYQSTQQRPPNLRTPSHDADVHTIGSSEDEDSDGSKGSARSRRSDDTLRSRNPPPPLSPHDRRRSRTVQFAESPTHIDDRKRIRAASPTMSDIFGNEAAEYLASFEGSLIDLADPSDTAIQRADDTLNRLQKDLVGEVVSPDDIKAATSNVDVLEEEAGLKE